MMPGSEMHAGDPSATAEVPSDRAASTSASASTGASTGASASAGTSASATSTSMSGVSHILRGQETLVIGALITPSPPTVPAPPMMQTATQVAALQSTTQVASQPMQTQTVHAQTMAHLQPVHSATAVPPPPMSTASAVVAQSSHYVMQQALSLQPSDMIKVYENLRKHLHSEGLLRGMSVSARTKRRVQCLKDGCPGRTPPFLHGPSSAPPPPPPFAAISEQPAVVHATQTR